MLTIIEDLGMTVIPKKSPTRKHYVRCRCDCGNEWIGQLASIKNGTTKSCGCLLKASYQKYKPRVK